MATLQARIEGYIGSVTETTVMDSSLQEAVNNLVQVLPVDKAMQYTTEKTAQAGTGIVISGRIFDVRNDNQPSRQVSTSLGQRIKSAGNTTIYKSSATFPVHWVFGGKVYGHPQSGGEDIIAYVLEAPTVSASDNSIAGLPQGTDELSIFYSCQSILSARLNALSVTAIENMPTAPTAPAVTDMEEPNIAYTTNADLEDYLTLASGTIGNSTDQLDLTKQFSVIAKLIENEEDVEIAQTRLAQAAQYLDGLKTKIQDEVNDFSAQVAQHQSEQSRTQVLIQKYQSELQEYANNLQVVISNFQAKLQEFQANQQDLLAQIQYFGNLYTQKLQLLTASNDGAELNRAGS